MKKLILSVLIVILVVGVALAVVNAKDTTIDVLSWKGWERSDPKIEVKYDKDDGILKIVNKFIDVDAYAQSNNRYFLSAKKPFEIRLKMETRGISHTESTQLGLVRLHDSEPYRRPNSWLSVGLGTYDPVDSNHLYLELVHREEDKSKNSFQYIIQKDEKIVIPQGIVLGIKIEDDDNSVGEKITIYNPDTGEVFYQTNLPYELFKKETLFFGFESWNITKDPQGVQMEISNLSVLFPRTVRVKKNK